MLQANVRRICTMTQSAVENVMLRFYFQSIGLPCLESLVAMSDVYYSVNSLLWDIHIIPIHITNPHTGGYTF